MARRHGRDVGRMVDDGQQHARDLAAVVRRDETPLVKQRAVDHVLMVGRVWKRE